jgi:hypothetical protein
MLDLLTIFTNKALRTDVAIKKKKKKKNKLVRSSPSTFLSSATNQSRK